MALLFEERCGYTPVVSYRNNFIYAEHGKINGKSDPFEYYFMQPANISIQSALRSAKVVRYKHIHFDMTELMLTGKFGVYDTREEFFKIASLMQKKYIKLNPKV